MTAVNLGPVAPFVKDVAELIAEQFPSVEAIGGWRASATDMGGHPAGLALDIMLGGSSMSHQALGKSIWTFLDNNAAKFEVKYTIYLQTLKYPGKPGERMDTRSGAGDVNHLRHVHVSFNPAVKDGRRLSTAGIDKSLGKDDNPLVPNSVEGVTDGLAGFGEALTRRETWVRVSKVVGGAVLMYLGAFVLMRDNLAAAVGVVTDVVPQAKAAKVAVKATAAASNPSS